MKYEARGNEVWAVFDTATPKEPRLVLTAAERILSQSLADMLNEKRKASALYEELETIVDLLFELKLKIDRVIRCSNDE